MSVWERVSARPLPPDLWERLVDSHPPTLQQRAAGHGWDPHSIRWPSIAAACVIDDQPLTPDEWQQLHDAGGITDHEADLLAAVVAQLSARAVQAGLTDRLRHDPAFRLELDYWCDICAIAMYELKECECCQGPIELRRRKTE